MARSRSRSYDSSSDDDDDTTTNTTNTTTDTRTTENASSGMILTFLPDFHALISLESVFNDKRFRLIFRALRDGIIKKLLNVFLYHYNLIQIF